MSDSQFEPPPEEQERQEDSPSNPAQNGATLWPPATREPSALEDINVLLIFHGLMGFALNKNYVGRGGQQTPQRVCEVGILTEAPDHEFMIAVLESTPPHGEADLNLLYKFTPERPHDVPGREVIIDLLEPTTPGVTFYQSAAGDPVDARDWKRVPDLEGPNFYDRKLVKRPKSMRLKVIVKHGLFFTAVQTDREFVRVDEDQVDTNGLPQPVPEGDLGQVAYLAAAELGHGAGGGVTLKVGQEELTLRATGGKKYYIFVLNGCASEDCSFKPDSPIKERRNDFHMYRRTFRLATGEKELGLMLKPGGTVAAMTAAEAQAAAFVTTRFSSILPAQPFSSHEAPCGATGYGRTDDGFGGGG